MVRADLVSGDSPLPHWPPSSPVTSRGRRSEGAPWVSSVTAAILFCGIHLHNGITSQTPHFLKLFHWALDFKIWNGRRAHKYLVSNRRLIKIYQNNFTFWLYVKRHKVVWELGNWRDRWLLVCKGEPEDFVQKAVLQDSINMWLGKEYIEARMYNTGTIQCVVLERDDHAYYIHILLALYGHKYFKP